ncbi:hypothetical protein RF11_07187 [Thelohanellus kitauei]|uniref:Uncharacterized protein n=1 Tax=Thelohanellus kitauei TaxID=669202 RepID=A0A0C2J8X2_THEKT|nr:hypothetical protein RF11_07187 [Thelohanellus kitauei]
MALDSLHDNLGKGNKSTNIGQTITYDSIFSIGKPIRGLSDHQGLLGRSMNRQTIALQQTRHWRATTCTSKAVERSLNVYGLQEPGRQKNRYKALAASEFLFQARRYLGS